MGLGREYAMSRDLTILLYLAVLALGFIGIALAFGPAKAAEPLLIDDAVVGLCASGPVMRAGLNELNYRPIWRGSSDILEEPDQLDRPMTLWETRAGT